mgnify:CR=1 FL=1
MDWYKIIDVPEGTIVTEETIDNLILAFEHSGAASQRETGQGHYPESSWESSDYRVPTSVSFGMKRIPGANPFYFSNQEEGYPKIDVLTSTNSD